MFKIVLSGNKQTIPVLNLEEVKAILRKIQSGDKIIICSHGIFNPSYLVAILEDSGGNIQEYQIKKEQLENKTSKFTKLLTSESINHSLKNI